MSARMNVFLGVVLAATCGAHVAAGYAADQPATPVVTVVKTVGDSIGADLTVEVTNPNAFALDLVFVDCMGTIAEKKYVYGPAGVHFKDIAANGKATGDVDMIVDTLFEALRADPDMKQFPEPTDIKCQVRSFQTPLGHTPDFKYEVPAFVAPTL